MTIAWTLQYTAIVIAMCALLVSLHRNRKQELSRLSAIFAVSFTSSAAMLGLFGMLDIKEMSARRGLDYGFEGNCRLVSIVGFACSCVWFGRSRNRYSGTSLVISSLVLLEWTLIAGTS